MPAHPFPLHVLNSHPTPHTPPDPTRPRPFGAVTWLNALGHSVNRAVHGDPSVPLPIPVERVEHMYRWEELWGGSSEGGQARGMEGLAAGCFLC